MLELTGERYEKTSLRIARFKTADERWALLSEFIARYKLDMVKTRRDYAHLVEAARVAERGGGKQ